MALKSTRSSRSSRSSTQNTRNSSRSSSNREPNARQRAQIGRQLRGLQDSVSNIARSRGLQWDSGSSRYNRINTRDQRQEAPLDSETINSQSLAQTKPIELPSQPETQNYNGILAGNNSATASILSSLGYTQDENGQFVQSPQTGTTTSSGFDAGTQGRFRNLVAGLGLMPQKQSVYDDPEYQKQQRVVQREQRNLNNYTASLNSIVAKSQADQLSVTGQGRGIPEAIIGGQQAQIAKEAAIQAIPVQAQIAASQGNLELATAQLDQLYKIKSESLQNDYEYKANQYNAIRDFLTKEETRQLNLLDQENDRRYSEGQDFLQLQDSYMKSAIANGTSTVGISSARNRAELYKAVSASGIGNGSSFVLNPGASSIENNSNALLSLFSSGKVSATNKKTIGDGLALAQAAIDLANSNSDGDFTGLYPGRGIVDFFTPEAFKRDKTVKNESLISALELQTQFWASGAALSDEQTKLVQKMIPKKTDSDRIVKAKVNQLVNYMFSQTVSRLRTDGINFKPIEVNLFETNELLQQASPEQLQELRALGLI